MKTFKSEKTIQLSRPAEPITRATVGTDKAVNLYRLRRVERQSLGVAGGSQLCRLPGFGGLHGDRGPGNHPWCRNTIDVIPRLVESAGVCGQWLHLRSDCRVGRG